MNKNYSSVELAGRLLVNASAEEKLALTKVFTPEATQSPGTDQLGEMICRNGGHGIANLLRGHGIAYSELLSDVAEMLKISGLPSLTAMSRQGVSIAEMDSRYFSSDLDTMYQILWREDLDKFILDSEKAILAKIATEIYSNMNSEQRKAVDRKIQEVSQTVPGQSLSGVGTAGALVVLGNLGGFATYTLMSTIISSITFGTVSFGVYTFASSALSVLLGPVGVVGVGAAAIYKFAGPDERKSLQSVATVALTRQRLIAEKVLKF